MTIPDLFNHYINNIYIQGGRYFIAAGLAYLIFYIWKRQKFSNRRIQNNFPKKSQIAQEILYSVSTILIFGVVGLLIFIAARSGHTLIYHDISKYGYAYLLLSFVLSVFIHDTYFYWMHRTIHHKKIFKIAHKVHHLSNNPTPWAAYAFHPVEAVLEAGIFPILVFTLPFHPIILLAFITWQIYFNVGGHLGYEIYPKRFMQSGLSKIFNTSTHHNMHHSKFKGNYGLYFRLWDKWMGTEFKEYESTYNSIVNRERSSLETKSAEKINQDSQNIRQSIA